MHARMQAEDTSREVSGLDHKIDSLAASLAAALEPIHKRLQTLTDASDELRLGKEDRANCVHGDELEAAMARVLATSDERLAASKALVASLSAVTERLHAEKVDRSEALTMAAVQVRRAALCAAEASGRAGGERAGGSGRGRGSGSGAAQP